MLLSFPVLYAPPVWIPSVGLNEKFKKNSSRLAVATERLRSGKFLPDKGLVREILSGVDFFQYHYPKPVL